MPDRLILSSFEGVEALVKLNKVWILVVVFVRFWWERMRISWVIHNVSQLRVDFSWSN